MRRNLNVEIESKLIELVNTGAMKKGKDVEIDKYQKVDIYIYDRTVLNAILKEFKFKDAGTLYDYTDYLDIPESIDGYMASLDADMFQKLAVSKKCNSVAYYTKDWYSINCMFLVDLKHLKKFLAKVGEYLKDDALLNEFRDADLSYKPKSYLDIVPSVKDETKDYDIMRKVIGDEGLVFDEKSTIYAVKKEIESFFSKKTEDLYKNLKIPYKRGIILFGEPGNGKSAMIRELVRNGPDVTKIKINSSISDVPFVLGSIISALDKKKAIIFIEDLDSMINESNRSEFLNILDGSDINSGIFMIGTTNYPERIDSGFMNRGGRFDKMYKIENPTDATRSLYFESRHLYELFKDYKITDNTKKEVELVKLFVENSRELPMASLKEIITNTSYRLLMDESKTVEEAVTTVYTNMMNDRTKHEEEHKKYQDSLPKLSNAGVMNTKRKK